MKVTLENSIPCSASCELTKSIVSTSPKTMQIDQLQSLAKKHSMIGNFFEFNMVIIELLYRIATSIVYIPISFVLWIYHQVLDYNRDKYNAPLESNYKFSSFHLPKLTDEKKKEYNAIVDVFYPPLAAQNFLSRTVFQPAPNLNEIPRKNAFTFLQNLDHFLDRFNTEVKKLKIPNERLKLDVMGFAYSPTMNRKEFLQACLKDQIDQVEHLNEKRNSSTIVIRHPYTFEYDSRISIISAECYGYVPSLFGWIDSWSLKMTLSGNSQSYHLNKSYHWTSNNADTRLHKMEKNLKTHNKK